MGAPLGDATRAAIARALTILVGDGVALRLRLWDGSEVGVGGRPAFTLVVRDRATFRRVFRSTRTRALAEAFVEDRVDVEGDLFAALRAAAALEERRLAPGARLAVWRALRRV
jgi:hypothetical protein